MKTVLFSLLLWTLSAFSLTPLQSGNITPLINKNILSKQNFQKYINRIQFKLPTLHKLIDGKFTFLNSKVISFTGLPELPVVVRKITVPKGYVAQASLENVEIEKIDMGRIEFKKGKMPYVWSKLSAFSPPRVQRYFPEKFLRQIMGDEELLLAFYPIQYDLERNEFLYLRSANVKLDFQLVGGSCAKTWGESCGEDSFDAIILTSRSLSEGAEILRKFHKEHMDVHSEIVFVEDIDRLEVPIDEKKLPEGYKNHAEDSKVKKYDEKNKAGYNYDLAKKIIAFLNKRMGEDRLKYLAILGDSLIVPPSYYFSIRSFFGDLTFGVTDACYGASDKCLTPRFAVGRLPFSSNNEIKEYIDKVKKWLKFANTSTSELSIYGGKAFRGTEFIGEIGTLRLLNLDGANWSGVKKYFRTKKNYNKENVKSMLEAKTESSFVYYLDHGDGNRLYVEGDYVTSDEILSIKAPEKVSDELSNPFIASISCTNAAFDRELVDSDIFSNSDSATKSIGESVLLSKAGGIAYLGSGRPALGQPVYNVDANGNLHITGSTHSMQLLELFYESYLKNGEGRTGKLLLDAIRAFLVSNDVTKDDTYLYAYFNLIFLGDPVLQLPPRQKRKEVVYDSAKSVTVFSVPFVRGYPSFKLLGDVEDFFLDLEISVDVKSSLFKVPKSWGLEEILKEQELMLNEGQLQKYKVDVLKNEAPFVYLLKLENSIGMPFESRVWFGTTNESVDQSYLVNRF